MTLIKYIYFDLVKEIQRKNGMMLQKNCSLDLKRSILEQENNVDKDGLIILIQLKLKVHGQKNRTKF